MNKLKTIGLTALGTTLFASAASAGSLGVSASAQITFVGQDNADTGNGWSMTDSMSFSGSADLDNGWTVNYAQALDGGTGANTEISVNMGDMGTYTFSKAGTGGPVGAWDDVTPTANEEAYANVTGATGPDGGFSTANSHNYTNDSLMDGVQVRLGYQPSSATLVNASTEYGIKYTGIDGLDIGFATGENEGAAAVVDNTVLYAKYAIDAFTIGVQDNETDSETASADTSFRGYGVSYAVNDDLSVSYGFGSVEYENSSLEDQDFGAVSFSWTNGSMTVSGTHADVDNIAGTATNDRQGYELNIKFAF
jgi:outer membrane protein OmpU